MARTRRLAASRRWVAVMLNPPIKTGRHSERLQSPKEIPLQQPDFHSRRGKYLAQEVGHRCGTPAFSKCISSEAATQRQFVRLPLISLISPLTQIRSATDQDHFSQYFHGLEWWAHQDSNLGPAD